MVEVSVPIDRTYPPKGTEMGNYFRNNIRNYYACITGSRRERRTYHRNAQKQWTFENTIVVFTSDHGICMELTMLPERNIFYEESMRIPMIISWPAKIKPRKDDRLMIAFADLYPSLILDGISKGNTRNRTNFRLIPSDSGKEKKRLCNLIIMYSLTITLPDIAAYVRQPTFAVHATNGKIDETVLFDRTKDPYQMDNIAGQSPPSGPAIQQQLKAWLPIPMIHLPII